MMEGELQMRDKMVIQIRMEEPSHTDIIKKSISEVVDRIIVTTGIGTPEYALEMNDAINNTIDAVIDTFASKANDFRQATINELQRKMKSSK